MSNIKHAHLAGVAPRPKPAKPATPRQASGEAQLPSFAHLGGSSFAPAVPETAAPQRDHAASLKERLRQMTGNEQAPAQDALAQSSPGQRLMAAVQRLVAEQSRRRR